MMALRLRDIAYSVHEGEGGSEIREFVRAHEMVLVDDVPLSRIRQHSMEISEILPLKRRHTASAGNAGPVSKSISVQDDL